MAGTKAPLEEPLTTIIEGQIAFGRRLKRLEEFVGGDDAIAFPEFLEALNEEIDNLKAGQASLLAEVSKISKLLEAL